MAHQTECPAFADVLDALILRTPTPDESVHRPYAISNGKTYQPIAYCPFCGVDLRTPTSRAFLPW